MSTDAEHITIYGGPANYYRQLKAELEEEWGYEPGHHDVLALLLDAWKRNDDIIQPD